MTAREDRWWVAGGRPMLEGFTTSHTDGEGGLLMGMARFICFSRLPFFSSDPLSVSRKYFSKVTLIRHRVT